MTERVYPDDVAGPFPVPPTAFVDRQGRNITIRAYDAGEGYTDDERPTGSEVRAVDGTEDSRPPEFRALVEMYDAFDSADRAQGLPPGRTSAIRRWLDTVLASECFNVIAWHEDDAVGHATLVPDADGCAYELAIFVLQTHQSAGTGTCLLETLLGYGAVNGVERVWLTVERWNRAAVSLYEQTGFETTNAESFELEMALKLGSESVPNGHDKATNSDVGGNSFESES